MVLLLPWFNDVGAESCCIDKTPAGITNELDMVAEYIRTTWPGSLTEAVCAMADVGDRGQVYRNGKASENVWWVWQILRATSLEWFSQEEVVIGWRVERPWQLLFCFT
jgi:hypothetical protein